MWRASFFTPPVQTEAYVCLLLNEHHDIGKVSAAAATAATAAAATAAAAAAAATAASAAERV